MLHREIPLDPVRRRQAFGLAAGALAFGGLLARPAAAATSGLVVIGKDGWLFPLWDATSRFDAGALHAATKASKPSTAQPPAGLCPRQRRGAAKLLPGR